MPDEPQVIRVFLALMEIELFAKLTGVFVTHNVSFNR